MSENNIKEILCELGYSLREENGGWRTNALFRNGSNSTALRIFPTGDWLDFVQNKKGSFEELIALTLGNKTIEQAKDWLRNKNYNISDVKPSQPKIKLPKTLSEEDQKIEDSLLPNYDYWIKRGIDPQVLHDLKSGLCLQKGKMKDRYVFPVYNNKNEVIALNGRDVLIFDGNKRPKWKFLGSKSVVYPAFCNFLCIKSKKEVYLVESIGDCLALFTCGIKNVLVLFGVEMQLSVLNFLLKHNISKINICLNNDSDNNNVGNLAAQKLYRRLGKYLDLRGVKILECPCKDWNDLLVIHGEEKIVKYLK
jgi:hypothetical protein